MSRARLRFWIEVFVLVVSISLIGILGMQLLFRDSDFSGYNKFPKNPSLSFWQIKAAFINSDTIPEALDAILYCSFYPDMGCCGLGGVRHCKV